MNTRHITLTVGAAAGGMLVAAFMQTAVAAADVGADGGAAANSGTATDAGLTSASNADAAGGAGAGPAAETDPASDPFGLTPSGDPDLTGGTGVPPFFDVGYGTQTFDFDSNDIAPYLQDILGLPTGDDAVTGSATLDVTDTDLFGITNQGITLPEDVTLGDQTLEAGSTLNVTDFGAGFENVYADLPGFGDNDTDQVVDYLVTPFGNFDVSNFVDPFDLSDLGGGGDAGGDAGGSAGADAGADLASSALG
jgi:hypothetical protein